MKTLALVILWAGPLLAGLVTLRVRKASTARAFALAVAAAILAHAALVFWLTEASSLTGVAAPRVFASGGFAVDELAARIRLRLRLGPAVENTVLRHGELVVDTEFGDVTVDGRPVSLSPTEYALLMALMAEPGEVVPPHRLAREVWSEPASSNLVQVYISYLRRKIGAERIRTVRGEGYVLEA